jgi:hypothetical protein
MAHASDDGFVIEYRQAVDLARVEQRWAIGQAQLSASAICGFWKRAVGPGETGCGRSRGSAQEVVIDRLFRAMVIWAMCIGAR